MEQQTRELNEHERQALVKYLQERIGFFNGINLFQQGSPWLIDKWGYIHSKKVNIEFYLDDISKYI